ncbi:DUF4352 domain-containing protein [Jeotgalibacillus marinus]|uniref:DUF4352 domain-containing protein n=1 Tax=Jeotgalibacillus marinus TaxID=86667 RepID=A0ABV3Q4B8_9BACL
MKKEKVKKPFYKKWWVWLLAVIIIATVASGGDDEDKAGGEEPAEDVAGDNKEESGDDTIGIGTPLDVKGVVFTINEVTTSSNIGGDFGQDAKGEFLIIDVTVENDKDEAITVDSSFFKLQVDGVEYDADGTAAIYANENAQFFLESVNPGLSLTGKVPFDAPEGLDISSAQIQVQTGFFGTETGLINLQ